MRESRVTGRWALNALLIAGAAAMLFPFAWTVITSITGDSTLNARTPSLIPAHPTLGSYRQLFNDMDVVRLLGNSAGLAVASTALQVGTSAMAAYAFARLDFRGKSALFVVYLGTLMIPFQVLVVPLFIEMKTLKLINTYPALLAPTIASAFGVFLIRQAIQTLPRDLDEAALIDGAGHVRIFAQIVLPNVRPALATLAIFSFLASWNSFLWPLVIVRSPKLMTLPLGLSILQGEHATAWNVVMAGSVVTIVPIVALYLFSQRHVIQSVAQSGLK